MYAIQHDPTFNNKCYVRKLVAVNQGLQVSAYQWLLS